MTVNCSWPSIVTRSLNSHSLKFFSVYQCLLCTLQCTVKMYVQCTCVPSRWRFKSSPEKTKCSWWAILLTLDAGHQVIKINTLWTQLVAILQAQSKWNLVIMFCLWSFWQFLIWHTWCKTVTGLNNGKNLVNTIEISFVAQTS